MIDMIDLLN